VDATRKRLGGRASTEAGAGAIVTLPNGKTGVVLFVRGAELDVWLERDVVRRTRREDTSPADGAVDRELYMVASDARAFADLAEGDRVTFEQDGVLRQGVLVEKCRFGGLVELGSSAILGVGFRRLLAAPR